MASDSPFTPSAVWQSHVPKDVSTSFRLGNGRPGPEHWQNHVDYTIEARLDTAAQSIHGSVRLRYTNNSPSPLSSLWINTDTDTPTDPMASSRSSHIHIQNVTVKNGEQSYQPVLHSRDSQTQIRLQTPISARGGTISVSLSYNVSISSEGLPKRSHTPNGVIYAVDHWYPQILSYSTHRGWTSSVPHGGSPHSEYGSFDYSLTVPASMIVAGSGTLMNPDAVLTGDQRRRLMRARDSQRKVAIITPDQAGRPGTRPVHSGLLTWNYQINGVRSVGWAASPAFIWNAARIARPDKRDALAMSYYPRSSMGGLAWNRATYHVQKSAEYFSRHLYAYPWNNAITVATPTEQRAIPGLSFCPHTAARYTLFACSIQNQSQNWVSGIISPNTSRYPWMSEGLGTYLSVMAHRHLYKGEFAPKQDEKYGADEMSSSKALATLLQNPTAVPILSPSNATSSNEVAFRTAYGMKLLREYILTPKGFDYALKQFIHRWAFQSPTPTDFFRTIEDATGQELSWFWTGWFRRAWPVDLSVEKVLSEDDEQGTGAVVTVALHRKMPTPVEMSVHETDGDTSRIHLPVDIWKDGPRETVRLETDSPLDRVVIDPDQVVPDVNLSNNTWSADAPPASQVAREKKNR